jgi:hypothetical protein
MKAIGFLLLPFGLVIGLLLGRFLFSAPADLDTRALGPEQGSRAPAAPAGDWKGDPSVNQPAPPPAREKQGVDPRTPGLGTGRSALNEANRAATGSPAARGTAALRGQVRTATAAALPGVQVRLVPLAAKAQALAEHVLQPAVQSPEQALTDRARGLLAGESQTLFASTAGDGSFAVDLAAERVYSIHLELAGWRFECLETQSPYVLGGSELNFLATPSAVLELDLIDAAGQPLQAALLAYRPADEPGIGWEFRPWSRAAPRLEFEPGSYRLVALSAGANAWCPEIDALWLAAERSPELERTFTASAAPLQERWQLSPQPTLYGQLRWDQNGAGVVDSYSLALLPPGSDPAQPALPGVSYTQFRTPHFLLTPATAGPYELHCWPRGSLKSSLLGQVELPQGNLRQDFRLAEALDQHKIFVTATTADGSPMESLGHVAFWARQGGSTISGYSAPDCVLPLAPGRFELRPPVGILERFNAAMQVDNPVGMTGCEVTHPLYGAQMLDFVPGQSEYQLTYAEVASLTVQLLGAPAARAGQFYKLDFARQNASNALAAAPDDLFPDVGDSGRWSATIEGLQPGPMDVELELNEGTPTSYTHRPLMAQSINLKPGPNTLAFHLDQLSDLRVRMPADAVAVVTLRPQVPRPSGHGNQRLADIGADGVAVFPQVAPGDYLIVHAGFMPVTCPTGEVEFKGQPANRLWVEIWDPSGSMYQAGLRSGDMITAIDGAAYAQEAWFKAVYAQDAPERNLQLSLRRDGSPLQLSVPNRAFKGSAGGSAGEFYEP